MKQKIMLFLLLAAAFASPHTALTKEISPRKALDKVDEWLEKKPRHSHRTAADRADTYSLDGTNLFHLVALENGGFVAVSAEDEDAPILGFSGSGDIPELDEKSPLWSLLAGSTSHQRGMKLTNPSRHKPKRKTSRHKRTRNSKTISASSTISRNSDELADETTNPITESSILDSVWVEPLVKSKWSQVNFNGEPLYNRFTPNNYPCGCVATAMAQLMRYHEYPSTDTYIPNQTFLCYLNHLEQETVKEEVDGEIKEVVKNILVEVPTELVMEGDGKYDWSQMPLVPDSTIKDDERDEIGYLCYNAGVSVRMQYADYGSGAYAGFVFDPLTNVFKYANAKSLIAAIDNIDSDADVIQASILANLDARFPCLLGIASYKDGGHAILADGYGFKDETLYLHLNMGWSGAYDYWYAIPDIPASSYHFTEIGEIVYNIFPTLTGEIVSGRITDPFGNPVEGADVTLNIESYSYTTNVTSDAKGIYSAIIPNEFLNEAINITAQKEDYKWASKEIPPTRIEESNAPCEIYFNDLDNIKKGNFRYAGDGEIYIGNSWGNDLVLTPIEVEAASCLSFKAAKESEVSPSSSSGESSLDRDGFSLNIQGTKAAEYKIEYCEDLAKGIWNTYTNILVELTGTKEIFLPFDSEKPSCFFRVKPATSSP